MIEMVYPYALCLLPLPWLLRKALPKSKMTTQASMKIPFYGPVIPKRYRSPNGRMRTSYVPMFPNYIFMFGSEPERSQAMTSNCISRYD